MNEPLTFDRLRAANVARCEEFHPLDSWSPHEWLGALIGEIGEFANLLKKLKRLETHPAWNKPADRDPEDLRARMRGELADAQIYLNLLAARLDIDLGEATRETFNSKSEEMGSEHFL